LDPSPPFLAFLVKRADPGKAGDGDLLASRRFSAVLAVTIATMYTRTAIDQPEVRQLIRRMKADNPIWGAPRIRGELLQLGFAISEPTVSRYLQRLKRRCDPSKAKRRLTFLNNYREVTAAFDFFTMPTLTFRVLYCFFVIEHSRRKILHFHTTAHPTSEWIVQLTLLFGQQNASAEA
jgi:hypothetical protein